MLFVLCVLLLLFLLLTAAIPLVVAPIIRSKLTATVAAHLHAELKLGGISYRPPFTVHLYDVKLVADPDAGGRELFAARRIDLTLAELPIGNGPLVIERLNVDGPTLHIARSADGRFTAADVPRGIDSASKPAPAMKLSDVLRLRNFSMTDGTLIYEDPSHADSASTEWKGITSEMKLAPRSGSVYGFHLDAADAPIVTADVDGTFDVDALVLEITKLNASVQAPDARTIPGPDPLPPSIRALFRQYGVSGILTVSVAGQVPLMHPADGGFKAELGLQGARASLPDSHVALDSLSFALHAEREPPPDSHVSAAPTTRPVQIQLVKFQASTGGVVLHLDPATASIDAQSSVNPHSGVFVFPTLIAHYGRDEWTLQRATVPLGVLPDRVEMDDIQVQVHLDPHGPEYPDEFGALLDSLHPTGPFTIQGTAAIDRVTRHGADQKDQPANSPAWDLTIATDGGALALTDQRIPVTALKGALVVTRHALEIKALQGNSLGGLVRLSGDARFSEPLVFQGRLNVTDASVNQLAHIYAVKSPDGREPQGQIDLDMDFFSRPLAEAASNPTTASASAERPSLKNSLLAAFRADGQIQVNNGDLWSSPLLEHLADKVHIARETLTAGEAASRFRIADRVIQIQNVAISSPALGLSGSGTVGFDGRLNLDVVLAPLGSWRQKIKEIDIPLLGSAASIVAGQLQQIVNKTQELIYEFRVTGTRDNADIEAVPVPFLTDRAARLFSGMLHPGKNDKLMNHLDEK